MLDLCQRGFVGLVRYLFLMEDVKSFLSQSICKDPLERFFGCRRQRGATHDNPNAQEFMKNTQALRVVNSVARAPLSGNCQGGNQDEVDKGTVSHSQSAPATSPKKLIIVICNKDK